MKKLLVGVVVLPLLAGAGLAGYRALSRDYQYFQLVQLGNQLLAEGLPFQASRTYGTAIGIRPAEPIAYIKRAEAERRQGNLSPAVEDLEKAGSLSTDVLLVSRRLADIYDELGRFDDAALHYERVLDLDPESPDVLEKLGLVHFRAGREAEAIEALNRAASSRTGSWEPFYLRGAVFWSLGGLDEAEADFLRALKLAPDAALPRSALIELYLNTEQASKTMPLVRAEIDDNPGAAQPYLHLADVHRLAGRSIDAVEAVALALEQDPNLPAAYLRLDELWLEEGSSGDDPVALEKAATALESVVKMDPSNGRAALALGRAYLAMGDEPQGFAELQRAGVATPVQAEAPPRLLGDLYRARGNHAEAVTAYHVFLMLKGDSPAVLERLGDAYDELGNPTIAAEIYERLSELEPRRVTPLVKAARAYLASGDPGSAARACRRGLVDNPENQALLSLLDQSRTATTSTSSSPVSD